MGNHGAGGAIGIDVGGNAQVEALPELGLAEVWQKVNVPRRVTSRRRRLAGLGGWLEATDATDGELAVLRFVLLEGKEHGLWRHWDREGREEKPTRYEHGDEAAS